jgi:hypothetical protein
VQKIPKGRISFLTRRILLALPLLCVLAAPAVAVKVPALLEVPSGLAESRKGELKKSLKNLKERRRKLDAHLKSFSTRCASVDKGSSTALQCRSDQGKLIIRIKGYSASATTHNNWVNEAQGLQKVQGWMEARDPVWLKSIRNAALQSARSAQKFTHELNRSFRANKPPKPKAIRTFGALKAGEIILVNSEKPGGLVDVVQGFLDRKISSRPLKAPVSHALLYLGTSGSVRLFLDNQLGEGPRIIGEAEFRQRYSHRQLFTAQPTMPVDGTELFRAAADHARSNQATTKRGHGYLGTKYGVFGKDNFVCSETALFAVARASKGALQSLTHDLRSKKKSKIIEVTPGDIYDQDGNGYFTVRSLQLEKPHARR